MIMSQNLQTSSATSHSSLKSHSKHLSLSSISLCLTQIYTPIQIHPLLEGMLPSLYLGQEVIAKVRKEQSQFWLLTLKIICLAIRLTSKILNEQPESFFSFRDQVKISQSKRREKTQRQSKERLDNTVDSEKGTYILPKLRLKLQNSQITLNIRKDN